MIVWDLADQAWSHASCTTGASSRQIPGTLPPALLHHLTEPRYCSLHFRRFLVQHRPAKVQIILSHTVVLTSQTMFTGKQTPSLIHIENDPRFIQDFRARRKVIHRYSPPPLRQFV